MVTIGIYLLKNCDGSNLEGGIKKDWEFWIIETNTKFICKRYSELLPIGIKIE